ncbi:MAG TPA: ABC transporter permease [Cytophagales bacterium]|nr:ABC transporter permease [Cytophagales bacterium]
MLRFIIKRLSYGVLVMFGVTTVIFFIFHALPGDPVSMMAGAKTDSTTIENIKKELGLNKPLHKQYLLYINDLSFISIYKNTPENEEKYEYSPIVELGENNVLVIKQPYLRRSFQTNRRVDEVLMENLEGTLVLAFTAMLFATIVGIALGIFAALRQNTFFDHFIISSSVIGISAPSFVAAVIISMIFGHYLREYTGLNLTGRLWVTTIYGEELQLKNLILPAFTLGIRPLSIIIQLTRSSMLDVLSQDYVRTARAKGLKFRKVVAKHALKNALNPVITAVSGWLATLMGGAFFIEWVFNWQGIGFETIKSIGNLDFPIVMGATLLIALIFVIVNIIVDILYATIDPRIRLG